MEPRRLELRPADVLLAGLAGGCAEMLWIAAYAGLTPASGLDVARGVTQTLFPGSGEFVFAATAGIAIHMLLSVALAWLLARPLLHSVGRRFGTAALLPAALLALAGIWALNFLLVLPALNPSFVAAMPLPVTLASKLLFGAAMASVLQRGLSPRPCRARGKAP